MYENKLLNKLSLLALLIFSILVISSCNSEDKQPLSNGQAELDLKIAVFSDPHYFDPALGMPGKAFFDAKINSRKMIAESEEILNSAINMILANPAELVLIPGDLTKDGEKSSHEKFAQIIMKLKNAGKKVLVIPGNHDISNPTAYGYQGEDKYKTESVSSDEFRSIYAEFGYGDAVYKDENSLSYIAEPVPGLWIIAMDACRYRENTDRHVVGGKFDPQALVWIKSKIQEGKSKGKLMLGMLHHGILEHFQGQKLSPISSEFVIDDYQTISKEFAELGLNFVFTGHFHANDVASVNYGESFLYDIETGSLLTYPVPMRFINITQSERMDISTVYVDNVNIDTKGKSFQVYAKDYLTNDLDLFVSETLIAQFQLEKQIADELAPVGVGAFTAHYRGDEVISKEAIDVINKYSSSDNFTVLLFTATVESLYTDLKPQDNNISINMKTGIEVK